MWKNSNRAAVAAVTSVGKARRHWRAADWNFRGISSGHVAAGFMPAFKHNQRILPAVFERGHKAHGYVHSGTFWQNGGLGNNRAGRIILSPGWAPRPEAGESSWLLPFPGPT